MAVNEIHGRTNSLAGYFWYAFLVFFWYFIENALTSIQSTAPGNGSYTLLDYGIRLVIAPFILAGVFGGIHEQQRNQEISSVSAFFKGGKAHYWRLLGANLLSYGLFLLTATIISIASLSAAGNTELPESFYTTVSRIMDFPYSAITLFWFTAIVVERKFFPGLWHAIKTIFTNPAALAVGLGWAVMRYMDNAVLDVVSDPASLALDGTRAAVLAVGRVLVTVLALVVYKKARGYVNRSAEEELAVAGESPRTPGDGLARASFWFALVSFIPLLHIVALVVGVLALKRKKRFVMGPAIACSVGGFFTIFYLLVVGGFIVEANTPVSTPDYKFLAEANAELEPYVTLLEQENYLEVQQLLEGDTADTASRHWTLDAASALANLNSYNSAGALEDFQAAAAKDPERSEFYHYYGIALLENGQDENAAAQFEKALAIDPENENTARYLSLVKDAYNPSTVVSAVLFMLILILLFTVHEYGHAFAAWKLGDDTAKNLGRLTLNPIAHLDLFGSILLPAILLARQSGVMFGWAKPVPINPEKFKDPSKDQMVVSFAGPAVNLIVAMACFLILGIILLLVRVFWPEALTLNLAAPFAAVSMVGPPFARLLSIIIVDLKQLFYTSLILGFFNLIPIPPLDGSWIFSGILPLKLRVFFEKTRKFSFVIFILLVITPVLDYILVIPLSLAWGTLQVLVSAMGLG